MANPKIVLAAIAATLSVGLTACETVSVRTDAAKDLTAISCHTYAFANEHVAVLDQSNAFGNPINADRLRGAIQTNMSIRGIQEVDRAQADCVVGYAMGSRQVLNGYYGGFYGAGWGWSGRRGWGYGWGGGWGPGWGWDGPWVDNETRISVDLFDAKTHRAIWHATASQSAYELTGPAAVEKINLAASAIFAKFPLSPPAGAPVSPAAT
jgi:Domain of unknown function (DUF4136)